LLKESARGPLTRADLDVSAVGDNTNFWVDICSALKDDANPNKQQSCIDRATRNSYDISSCCSKWVTLGMLQKWYNTTHNALIMYRLNYDTSGNHNFDSEEGVSQTL
jgi:hypothetical protein